MRSRGLLLLGSLVVCAGLAELLLPLLPPDLGTMRRLVYNLDAEGHYALRPDLAVPFGGMFEALPARVTWQVNAQGMRADAPVGAPGRRFRIASYGDSETFGWSVDLDDTFQQRMQAIDPGIEVLNFGVPGFNAQDIADRVAETLPSFAPDLVLYVVNKNDSDEAIRISDPVLSSQLLLRLRFFYQVVIKQSWRRQARRSPERLAFLARQIDRIASDAEAAGVALVLGFLDSRTWGHVRAHAPAAGFVARWRPGAGAVEQVVDLDPVVDAFPDLDDHLGAEAYDAMAVRLCRAISGQAHGCRPAGWRAAGARARASDP